MWSLLLSLPGLANGLLNWLNKKTDADLELQKAYLTATVENNKAKASTMWWGAALIVLIAGVPAASHMAAVFLDSTIPPYGSWAIPPLPPPYDAYERDIVLSFFLVLPALPIAKGIASWLGRR